MQFLTSKRLKIEDPQKIETEYMRRKEENQHGDFSID
jgi:hypothetical protein